MTYMGPGEASFQRKLSPLVLSDRFLRLAEDADRAGFQIAAEHLLYPAIQVLDDPPSLAA